MTTISEILSERKRRERIKRLSDRLPPVKMSRVSGTTLRQL